MIKSGDPVVSSSEQFFWHVIPVSCICLVKGFIISSLILARSCPQTLAVQTRMPTLLQVER